MKRLAFLFLALFAATAYAQWGAGSSSGSGDITDVGDCSTGVCFATGTEHEFFGFGASGAAAMRSIPDAALPSTIARDSELLSVGGSSGDVQMNDGGVLGASPLNYDGSEFLTTAKIHAGEGLNSQAMCSGGTAASRACWGTISTNQVALNVGAARAWYYVSGIHRFTSHLAFGETSAQAVSAGIHRYADAVVEATGGFSGTTGDYQADRFRSNAQSETCADSGDGNPGTLTLTPTSTYVEITNADANGCTVTMGEGTAVVGEMIIVAIISNAGGTVDFADTAALSELSAAYNADINDTLTLIYGAAGDAASATYREIARSAN